MSHDEKFILLAASPCTQLSCARSTISESDFQLGVRLPSDTPNALTYSAFMTAETELDLPGSLTLPFPTVLCSYTPPGSPATSPLTVAYMVPSEIFDSVGPRLMRSRGLHYFTCVTAWSSLCLRLPHVVTSIRLRLDSRWGGSTPCRDGNFTRWKCQACPGAPKNFSKSISTIQRRPSAT